MALIKLKIKYILMKKLILSLAVAGTLTVAISACNSTKNVSDTADTTGADTTTMPVDTTRVPGDTMRTMPPDTTKMPRTQ